jgi:hypothetical protein
MGEIKTHGQPGIKKTSAKSQSNSKRNLYKAYKDLQDKMNEYEASKKPVDVPAVIKFHIFKIVLPFYIGYCLLYNKINFEWGLLALFYTSSFTLEFKNLPKFKRWI